MLLIVNGFGMPLRFLLNTQINQQKSVDNGFRIYYTVYVTLIERYIMKARNIAPDFYRVVEAQVRKAIALPENRFADGSINWNYIDADCYMAVNPTPQCRKLYIELFEEACDAVEKQRGLVA